MNKHTPGPWKVADDVYGTRVNATRNGKPCNIVTGMYDEENEPNLGELTANARLIAAAPELLAMVENLVASVRRTAALQGGYTAGDSALCSRADELIREATGQ